LFGKDGHHESYEDWLLKLNQNVKRRLRQWKDTWKNEWKDILGITLFADGAVSIVRLQHKIPLVVQSIIKFQVDPWQDEEELSVWMQNQAERIGARLSMEGWENIPRVYAVPEDKMFACLITLPPDMEVAEQKEAAYWEMAAQLERESLDIESFAVANIGCGDTQTVWSAAVSRYYLEQVTEAFRAAEIPLDEIIAYYEQGDVWRMDEQDAGVFYADEQRIVCPTAEKEMDSVAVRQALGVALCYAGGILSKNKRSAWLLNPERPVELWNYRFLATAMLTTVLLFLCLLTGCDAWQLYTTRQEAFKYQQELTQRLPQQKKMVALEQVRRMTEKKEQLLTALSRENIPWHSILVHFGTITVDGVWLNGLEMKGKDVLQIDGHAVSYDAVADFIKVFEKDTAFFPNGPVLESSGQDSGEKEKQKLPTKQIGFRMTIHL